MGRLNHESHVLQRQHHIPACILPQIQRSQIKIRSALMGKGGGPAVLIRMEQEELAFWPYLEIISHSLCLRQHLFQDIPRVTLKDRPVWLIYIADQPRNLPLLRPPREYGKCIRIRVQIHIRLLGSGKPFNGRAVKHDLIIQSLL